MSRKRVGVLISGRGSNLAALIAASRDPAFPAEIGLVLSNRSHAQGLARAAEAQIPSVIIDHRAHADKALFERAVDRKLREYRIELVACAGFMRIMTRELVESWRDRMINIHPSLLPAYRGLDTHARALADGVKIHGCTVHFVRHEVDHGPIIAQAAVPVLSGDTAEVLAARVLQAEHMIYPMALGLVASGKARVVGERVVVGGAECLQPPLIMPKF
jgi:phosphoribosylglycinamide formyltransferase-1